MSKYILVTSGVCSSLGKGVATSAIGSLLESAGLKIAIMKCDPYINIDAGTISPYQHGEVYVTEDGAETDSDLGNYSRFTTVGLNNENLVTIGKVYETVIRNERAGRYNGRTVQVIPHVTDEIKRRIVSMGAKTDADVVVVEIGGTVGDIESIPFLEVARQLSHEMGRGNCITVHLALVPTIIGGEHKSKPMQQSVKKLQETGIQPDILLCRADRVLEEDMRKKIAMFCNVGVGSVFTSTDLEYSIYELPISFHEQGLDKKIFDKLNLGNREAVIKPWVDFVAKVKSPSRKITVAMVGKKDYLDDCFKSVRESLFHAAVTSFDAEIEVKKIDAESLEETKDVAPYYKNVDAIIIPGNYGQRGFLGLLHLEIIQERLEREFDLDLVTTAPSVIYELTRTDGREMKIDNPANLPPVTEIASMREPFVRTSIYTPQEYVGTLMELCQDKRGVFIDMQYEGTRVKLNYDMPLNEIIFDFFDQIKSRSRGYASFDYELKDYRESDLVKLDILLNGDICDAFSIIVHRDKAYTRGRGIAEKLKDVIPRQMFEIPIQAAIGGKVIARETVKQVRKDVLAKCYGGDVSRKRKLLEKQKRGKKRMKQIGNVEVPQKAFLAVLKLD